MRSRTILCTLTGFAFSAGLFAQATAPSVGTPGGGRSTPTVPTTPNPSTTTTRIPGQTQNQTQFPDTLQRPIYVSGKVMLDDGTPPPESVVMQLVCNASPRSIGYTDSKGRFSIDLGNRNNSSIFADASQSGPGFGDSGLSSMGSSMPTTRGTGGSGLNERNLMG